MALFSNFCNICYKIDNESLKDISEVNMKYLNDILITFVGHADIINYNVIYLCQLCCEELTRVDKFREMCLSNLIQMRQRYINMKLEDNACAVQNTLQKFVYEQVLRKSSLEKSNCPVSFSTNCHGIIKSPEYVNKDSLVFNRQITNLQLETNDCDIKGACFEVSDINSVTECDESRVAVTNEEDIVNDMLTRSENTRLEKFEEPDEDYDLYDANNDNKSDTSQIEFIKEEYDLKIERENRDLENLTLKNDENESGEHANVDVKVPFVYNSGRSVIAGIACAKEELNVKQENSTAKKSLEDGFGDGLIVAFQIANVSTIVNMEEREHGNIRSEDSEVGMKLRSRGSNNKSTIRILKTRPSRPRVRARRNGECPTLLPLAEHIRVYSDAESHNCATCKHSFRTRNCFIGHVRSCNSDKCTICNKPFKQTSSLTKHKCIHSGARAFKCTDCHKIFTRSSNLTKHKRIHSGDKPYKCTICNQTYTRSSTLARHKRTHRDDRHYKCTVCNKAFIQPSNLARHERTHRGDRPYKCTVCNKSFTHSSTLAVHKRIHSGDRPYKCTICNKAFTRSSVLTVHKRIHSGDKPYKCTICNQTYTNSSALTVHKRTHRGDRPYKCTVCNKAFTQLSNLARHKLTHSGDRPYKCTVCNKTFIQSSTLTIHERIHSGDRPYKCTICNQTFTGASALTVHKRIHSGDRPYKCTICNQTFTGASALTVHKRKHSGDRPYKCTICNQTFTSSSALTVHKRIHSGDRPYKCTNCNKAFTQSSNLASHKRIHSGARP